MEIGRMQWLGEDPEIGMSRCFVFSIKIGLEATCNALWLS